MSHLLDLLASKEGFERADTFDAYLRHKAWENNIPLTGLFELTPRCTLNCKMCYVHLYPSQMVQNELYTEQWLTLIDQACEAGMMYATLSGGECMLHPGFKQVYEHLRSWGIRVKIFTNGTLLGEEMMDWLAKRPPQKIQISIYGSGPRGYEAVTGSGDAFYRVDRAIDLVQRAGIPLDLAVTVSKFMVKDFEEILRYCYSKGPHALNLSTSPFRAREETGREYESFAPSLDEQVEFYKIRMRMEGGKALPFKRTDEEVQAAKNLQGISCSAGRTRFAINWKGIMLACNAFDFVKAYPLKTGFKAAWEIVNECARFYRMPAECADCEYNTVCIKCPAAHWLAVGEGHCNPDICAEGRRMVEEGLREL